MFKTSEVNKLHFLKYFYVLWQLKNTGQYKVKFKQKSLVPKGN